MTGFVIERHGYLTALDLINALVTDMIANGFTQSYPSTAWNPATNTTAPLKVTLEAGPTVDPLNTGPAAQPWRVNFNVQNLQQCFMSVATPLQLDNNGNVAMDTVATANGLGYVDYTGGVGAAISNQPASGQDNALTANGKYANQMTTDETTKGLINRPFRVTGSLTGSGTNNSSASYPMSYRLVISPRGFWLGIWEDANTTENATAFNWVLVQRPVDRTTGTVLTDGKAPVFCVNGIGGKFWQFVVRESDILRPGKKRPADSNTEDSEGVINTSDQVSLSEDGKYIVTFPSRLNSSRYRYPHELDIMATTSADVVSQYSDVPLTVYGETSARSYKAMQASAANNTGVRLLILQSGGGISGS